jgi:hypothetical protein
MNRGYEESSFGARTVLLNAKEANWVDLNCVPRV